MSDQPYCTYPKCGCLNNSLQARCIKGFPFKGSTTAPSETPQVDAVEFFAQVTVNDCWQCVTADFARSLETALTESRAECERLRLRCVEEIRLRSKAAARTIAAEQFLSELQTAKAECERLRRDAERYEWLCADLDAEQRAKRSHIFNRMSVMGKGAIDAAIDAASAEGER